jgi:hypothetical protein
MGTGAAGAAGAWGGVKRPGREPDHSPPFSAEVKNGGTIHLLPHTFSWRRA